MLRRLIKCSSMWSNKDMTAHHSYPLTEGYQTPEIARRTDHTEEECDRYIKAYKKVEKLNKTVKSEEIANVLGMGKSLVDEYIRIINEE